MNKDLEYYKELKYPTNLFFSEGVWFAKIPLLNIMADGETQIEALKQLELEKNHWFEIFLEKGFSIPEPQLETV